MRRDSRNLLLKNMRFRVPKRIVAFARRTKMDAETVFSHNILNAPSSSSLLNPSYSTPPPDIRPPPALYNTRRILTIFHERKIDLPRNKSTFESL